MGIPASLWLIEDMIECPDGVYRTAVGAYLHMKENPSQYLPKLAPVYIPKADPFEIINRYGLRWEVQVNSNFAILFNVTA